MNAVTALADYRACEAALRNTDLKQAMYDAGKVVMDGVLLTLHGAEHSKRRAIEVRVFRRNFFFHYEKEVFPHTLAETLAPYLEAGGADLIEFGYRATANLTADFAGVDRPQKSGAESERLIRLVKKLSEGATLVHSTREVAQVEAEVAAALEEFDAEFLRPSVARRLALIASADRGEIDPQSLPRDVLTVILQARDELAMDDQQLLREIAFYMQAGAHSTANAVVHALHEIVEWAGDDAGRWGRLYDPTFVHRCVHESLRLHPASPEAWRVATCPAQLAEAGTLETGSKVVLDLFTANRDPAVFGESANRFDPDREVPRGVMPAGLAFGIGMHTCLGRELDGGVPAKPGSDPAGHQFGIVPLLVIRLLQLGARPDPDRPPEVDRHTSRPNWGRYPILFTRA